MESPNSHDNDENNIEKVIRVQNEASIIAAASDEVRKLSEKSFKTNPENTTNTRDDGDEKSVLSKIQKEIESGEITPFQALEKNKNAALFKKTSRPSELLDFEKYLLQQAQLAKNKKAMKREKCSVPNEPKVPQKRAKLDSPKNPNRSFKMRKDEISAASTSKCTFNSNENERIPVKTNTNSDSLDQRNHKKLNDSDSDYVPDEEDDSDEELKRNSRKKGVSSRSRSILTKKIVDDGDEDYYKQRVENSRAKNLKSFHKLDHLLKAPSFIWKKLYKYQKVSVRWLWELHNRGFGGLLCDEMGLGKTVQVIAFLACLDFSDLLSDGERFRGLGPTLIICPATLLEQWVSHLHTWYPTFRVVILHQSSSYQGDYEDLISSFQYGGILITSYTGVLNHKDALFKNQWHYVILDEGHKIRNPEAKITQVVKKFSTPHRILLTGSPMQNSLKELWSLFDFILPGKLGTLAAFIEHCAMPITRGGYSNASALQEATALQVATMLKDAITPYMLRRTKVDVQHHVNLPDKNEQVLFCSLTEAQTTLYKKYLSSDVVSGVIHEKGQKAKLLTALTTLRKICNHPDLFDYDEEEDISTDTLLSDKLVNDFGHWKRSGKLTVVRSLLKIWKKQGHRVLLFTQSKQMMCILEALLIREDHKYLTMDGTTAVCLRQQIVSKFNNNPEHFVFLLTTKVGGLGINLTGADRVIIYDPDWNPATDAQARERAWRIGQDKDVTIYRLITAGSIEEKIYHRQVFKLLLSSRVLEDPRQRRLFRTSDLTELFNLNEPISGVASESDQLFKESKLNPLQPTFSQDKIKAMRELASSLSKKIGKKVAKEEEKPMDESKEANKFDSVKEPSNERLGGEIFNVDNGDEKTGQSEKNKPGQLEDGEISTSSKDEKIEQREKEDKESLKKRQKKRRKKDKKSKIVESSALFEGERVSCLIGRRMGNSTSEQENSTMNMDDHYVLCKLFSKAAVSSAFQHESVLSNAKDSELRTPLERIAQETAQESMNYVRQSRKWCWMPNWNETTDEN